MQPYKSLLPWTKSTCTIQHILKHMRRFVKEIALMECKPNPYIIAIKIVKGDVLMNFNQNSAQICL